MTEMDMRAAHETLACDSHRLQPHTYHLKRYSSSTCAAALGLDYWMTAMGPCSLG
jgi:hypothetical protein